MTEVEHWIDDAWSPRRNSESSEIDDDSSWVGGGLTEDVHDDNTTGFDGGSEDGLGEDEGSGGTEGLQVKENNDNVVINTRQGANSA